MEMKYVLYSKVHKTNEAGSSWTFKYRPVGPDYAKMCIFTVSSDDPYDTMGKLGLPQEIGDIVSFEISPSNTQSKLVKGKKEAVD